VLIFRKTAFASFIGYFVGKKFGGREKSFFFAFGSFVVLWHLIIDIQLKSEGKYQ
jgi:hypothetical protein